uniref:Molybdenum ABC transporter, periplasmic molybdate-binding protein n=1 Tax=Geobacter sp. (strain M21) TaxID=443144 RepID=C6E9J2_GEOSM
MKKQLKSILFLSILVFSAVPALAGEVNLSVAASLKDVINELADRFTKKHPGVKFLKNYGGSGTLAKQIEHDAPADIFISANLEWMDYLKHKQLVDPASIAAFTYNTLVVAGTADKKISTMHDLLKLKKIAIGSPKSVPAGEYAVEAFKKAGLDKQLEKKLVMSRNVRECLMYAERGEVDGAVVYRTDALQAKKTTILFNVPQQLYPRVLYPAALTVAGAKHKEAVDFLKFLQSAEAKNVLANLGFASK